MTIRTLLAGLALAGVALSALPASAQTGDLRRGETVATLSSPLKQPFDDAIDGRMWHCEGTTCHVSPMATASGQSVARECANAAHRVGAFATYQTGATTVDGEKLNACNTGAKKS